MVLVIQSIHNRNCYIVHNAFFVFVLFLLCFLLLLLLFLFVCLFVFFSWASSAKCNNVIVPFRAKWKLTLSYSMTG